MLNNKKKSYTTYVLVCQNCTLKFSRTKKQNWIIICQMLFAYMAGGEGVGVRGFKMFCQKGSEFFLLALCGGVRFSTSPSVKKNRPPPINKQLVPIKKSPKGHYVAYLF